MPVTISMTFDDEWAARIAPAVQAKARGMEGNAVVRALLESRGVASVDELSARQQAKLVILAHFLWWTQQHEGDEAERIARQQTTDDLEQNFPLEFD